MEREDWPITWSLVGLCHATQTPFPGMKDSFYSHYSHPLPQGSPTPNSFWCWRVGQIARLPRALPSTCMLTQNSDFVSQAAQPAPLGWREWWHPVGNGEMLKGCQQRLTLVRFTILKDHCVVVFRGCIEVSKHRDIASCWKWPSCNVASKPGELFQKQGSPTGQKSSGHKSKCSN